MKIFCFIFAAILLSGCNTKLDKKTCGVTLQNLMYDQASVSLPGSNVYISASNFDTNNKDCWNYLTEYVDYEAKGFRLPVTIHVLDNLPNFELPADGGFYGTDEVRQKVIYQYSLLANLQVMDTPDPMAFGKYNRPE